MERGSMRRQIFWIAVLALTASARPLLAADAPPKDKDKDEAAAAKVEKFKPEVQASTGTVTVEGKTIAYQAYAGTLVVHTKDWDDVPQNAEKDDKGEPKPPPEASMFYVAYFKSGE